MSFRLTRRFFGSFALVLSLAAAISPVQAANADTALTNLIALSAERLALADAAARWKWLHHSEVIDPARTRTVLAAAARRAAAAGVEVNTATRFFRDQIEANQQIQQGLFVQWRRGPGPNAAASDLLKITRLQLDSVDRRILTALARAQPISRTDDCPSRLAQSLSDWRNLTRFDAARDAALNQALAHVCSSGGIGATG